MNEQLQTYYPFDSEVVGRIQDTAEWQNGLSFRKLADLYELDDATKRSRTKLQSLEYVELNPQAAPDSDDVHVLFAPMGNAATSDNIVMRALRMVEVTRPQKLIIAAGPAHINNPNNTIAPHDYHRVWAGDFVPVLKPLLRELAGIAVDQSVSYFGYSNGAALAGAALASSANHDISASHAVLAEPANVSHRSMLSLGRDFLASGKYLDDYIRESRSIPLYEATARADQLAAYVLGLARPGNLAIAHGLSRGGYSKKLDALLANHPDAQVTTVAGMLSELSEPATLLTSQLELATTHPGRSHLILLNNIHHAGGDNIDLHAAIMFQGLRLQTNDSAS